MENTYSTPTSSSKTERKIIERNRRNQMKELYSKLNSLVPRQSSREMVSLPDQLDEAAKYIKRLQIKLEEMRQRKERLMGMESNLTGLKRPQVEIHEMGSVLEVVLVTGGSMDSLSIFCQAIQVLQEEGAEIVNASFSAIEENVFHTIHSKVGDSAPGYGTVRISQRLKKLFNDDFELWD